MSNKDIKKEASDDMANRIEDTEWYSHIAQIGFAIIIIAFLAAVVGVLPSNMNSISAAIDAILLPLIFVGMAFLLLGIAMHLHLMHLNLIRQIQRRMNESDHKDNE